MIILRQPGCLQANTGCGSSSNPVNGAAALQTLDFASPSRDGFALSGHPVLGLFQFPSTTMNWP